MNASGSKFHQRRGRTVGGQQERLAGGKFERHAFVELVPDQFVQGLGILRPGREWIDDKKVDPAFEEVDRFRHEFPHGNLAGLVPRRHDLDGANDIAQVMPDNDPVGPLVESALSGMNHHPRARGLERGRLARGLEGFEFRRCTASTSG